MVVQIPKPSNKAGNYHYDKETGKFTSVDVPATTRLSKVLMSHSQFKFGSHRFTREGNVFSLPNGMRIGLTQVMEIITEAPIQENF